MEGVLLGGGHPDGLAALLHLAGGLVPEIDEALVALEDHADLEGVGGALGGLVPQQADVAVELAAQLVGRLRVGAVEPELVLALAALNLGLELRDDLLGLRGIGIPDDADLRVVGFRLGRVGHRDSWPGPRPGRLAIPATAWKIKL